MATHGDLWALGRHRVLCGDATVATDVERLLGGVELHLMVTDPPYGVEYDPGWRKEAGLASEGLATGKVMNDDRADWREAWALFPGAVAYVWHGDRFPHIVAESLEVCEFKLQAVYDPFLGSGTTIIAAEMEGRHCLGLEIEPGYVDVIVKRWQEFVGKDATLDGDGRTFSEVAAAR